MKKLFCFWALAALFAGLAVGPGSEPADAFVIEAKRWPGKTITYHRGSVNKWVVDRAVEAWNTSGVKVKFKPVKQRSKANVILIRQRFPVCNGLAQVGYIKGAQAELRVTTACPADLGSVAVVAHEFGHILGLGHELRRCSVMGNGTYGTRCKPIPDIGEWHCSVLKADDVRGAISLYGGKPKLGKQGLCPVWSPPLPATSATQVGPNPVAGFFGRVTLSVTVPQRPKVVLKAPYDMPKFSQQLILVSEPAPTCPEKPVNGNHNVYEVGTRQPGEQMRVEMFSPEQAGKYCVAVWYANNEREYGQRSELLWIDVDPAPAEASGQ